MYLAAVSIFNVFLNKVLYQKSNFFVDGCGQIYVTPYSTWVSAVVFVMSLLKFLMESGIQSDVKINLINLRIVIVNDFLILKI